MICQFLYIYDTGRLADFDVTTSLQPLNKCSGTMCTGGRLYSVSVCISRAYMRERERERESVCVCVCARVCPVCVCVFPVCVCVPGVCARARCVTNK